MTQPTDIRAALTEPVGEGPSAEAIAEMAEDLRWKRLPWAQGTGDSFLLDLALTVLARWGRPAAPAAPEVGDVGELIQCLRIRAASLGAEGANLRQRGDAVYFTRAATLLQQQAAPAPAVVPVAVEALTRLYWWGGMREDVGYSSDVVLGVRDWIDGGMVGGLPQLPRWIADRCPPLPQGGEGES